MNHEHENEQSQYLESNLQKREIAAFAQDLEKIGKISEIIALRYPKRHHQFDEHLELFHSTIIDAQDKGILRYEDPSFEGLGEGVVSVQRTEERVSSLDGKEFISIYSLWVCSHTDTNTRSKTEEALQEMDEKTRKRMLSEGGLGTIYYFSQEGDYVKVVTLPHIVEDNNPYHGREKDYYGEIWKMKKSQMLPGDYELVGYLLKTLRQKLLPGRDEISHSVVK